MCGYPHPLKEGLFPEQSSVHAVPVLLKEPLVPVVDKRCGTTLPLSHQIFVASDHTTSLPRCTSGTRVWGERSLRLRGSRVGTRGPTELRDPDIDSC